MTRMSYQECEENLSCMDVFFMAKIMQENEFHVGSIDYHSTSTDEMLKLCLSALQKKYPYFRIRPSKNEEYLLIFTIALPFVLRKKYSDIKKKFNEIFENIDCFSGEIITKWHYNEMHVQVIGGVYYHDLLKQIIKELKEIRKKEKLS